MKSKDEIWLDYINPIAIECKSQDHPSLRRIFRCPARRDALLKHNILRENLQRSFSAEMSEHEMVKKAIDMVVCASRMSGLDKAVYWEELSAIIQSKLGHPISKHFVARRNWSAYYIFQGIKEFDGKVHVLIISEKGDIYTGLVPPLTDPYHKWEVYLGQLKQVVKVTL